VQSGPAKWHLATRCEYTADARCARAARSCFTQGPSGAYVRTVALHRLAKTPSRTWREPLRPSPCRPCRNSRAPRHARPALCPGWTLRVPGGLLAGLASNNNRHSATNFPRPSNGARVISTKGRTCSKKGSIPCTQSERNANITAQAMPAS
jgi:hypothetical protein